MREKTALPGSGERSKQGDSGRSSPGLCSIPPIHPKAKVLLAKGRFVELKGEHKEGEPLRQKDMRKGRDITNKKPSSCMLLNTVLRH